MSRKNPVQHQSVSEANIEAQVVAKNAENGIKDGSEKGQAIVAKIRSRYSIQEEMAIQRKAIKKLLAAAGINDEEFAEYDAFVENAKAEYAEEQANRGNHE